MSYGNNNYGHGGDPNAQGHQDYGQPGGYPQQGSSPDQGGYPQQGDYQQQSYPQQSYPQQGDYQQQGYQPQGYPDQAGYPVHQGYAAAGYSGGYGAAAPTRPPVDLVKAVKQYVLNYANFYGRANKGEYWWVFLALVIIGGVLQAAGWLLGDVSGSTATMNPAFAALISLFNLATLVPTLAVGVRRLHDTGRSGWWTLIALVPLVGWIILLVFLAGPSKPEGARFDHPSGSQPKIATS